MIKLRELRLADAEKMMEYIYDKEISKNFLFTRTVQSIHQFENFITESWNDKNNFHFAIVNESSEYLGTISLKNISYVDKSAEYAIVIRKSFWGQGIAQEATNNILSYGFDKLNIEKIYLNVLSINTRANNFYKKYGFSYEGRFKNHVYLNGNYTDLNWYCMWREEYDRKVKK